MNLFQRQTHPEFPRVALQIGLVNHCPMLKTVVLNYLDTCKLHNDQRNTRKDKQPQGVSVEMMRIFGLQKRLINIDAKINDLLYGKVKGKDYRLLIVTPRILVEIYRCVGGRHTLCPQDIRMMTSCLLRFTHFIIPDHSKSII
jgi:hypothetical protein